MEHNRDSIKGALKDCMWECLLNTKQTLSDPGVDFIKVGCKA
jgi:hypothetical protein